MITVKAITSMQMMQLVQLHSAVKAEKLAFLTDVEGVYADPKDKDTLISELTTDHMEELLNSGNIGIC